MLCSEREESGKEGSSLGAVLCVKSVLVRTEKPELKGGRLCHVGLSSADCLIGLNAILDTELLSYILMISFYLLQLACIMEME